MTSNTDLSDMDIFKVIFYWEGGRHRHGAKDIINFAVDHSSCVTYDLFINSLQTHMPLLKGTTYTVEYDTQRCNNNIKTDEHFLSAIQSMKGNNNDVYKFYVCVLDRKPSLKTSIPILQALRGSTNQIQFKIYAYWGSDESKREVMRFDVEKVIVMSFEYLMTKIKHILPELKLKSFVVTWKDEEGDDVRIRTDEELLTAITAMSSSGLVKLKLSVEDSEMEKGN